MLRNLRALFLGLVICLLAGGSGALGQSPTPTANPSPSPKQQATMSFADTLRDFTNEAIVARQLFIEQVEKPMSGWISALAQLLALIMFAWAIAQGIFAGGFEPGDIAKIALRCAVGFLLLFFAGDVDGDGIRGDLINYPASVGYYYAYGVSKSGQIEGSFLNKYTTDQEKKFNQQYQKFVENKFMVKVSGRDLPVTYPSAQDVNLLAALYTGRPMNEDEIDKAKSREWQMSMLYGFFNGCRGLLGFADFFIFFISGFAVLVLRLALPLMIACVFNKEYSDKISKSFFWTAFVWTIIFPGVCQFIRLCAYSAGNVAMGLGGDNQYYTWDATQGKIISNGNPEAIIIMCALYMGFSALCLFAAFFLSMYLSQGKILEGIVSTTSAWFTAATSIGMGVATGAMASKLNMQADAATAKGARDSTMTEAGFARQSGELSAKASNEATKTLADSQAQSQKLQADYGRKAEDISAEAQYKSAGVGAFAGLVGSMANARIEGGQSRANALMSYRQDWMNADAKQRQEGMSNSLDRTVKDGDAYGREIQQSLKDYPQAKELLGEQVDNYLHGIPVVGSALETIGLNGKAVNTWLGGSAGKQFLGQMLDTMSSGGRGGAGQTGMALQNFSTTGGFEGVFGDANITKAFTEDMKNAQEAIGKQNTGAATFSNNGVPVYKQGNPQWSGRSLGSGSSIGRAGCAMAATSMAISKNSGRTINPGQLDAFLDQRGGYNGNSLNWQVAASSVGLRAEKQSWSQQNVNRQLDSGRAAVVGVDYKDGTKGGANGTDHWITLTGRSGNGNYLANDPATGKVIQMRWDGNQLVGGVGGNGNAYRTTGQLMTFSGGGRGAAQPQSAVRSYSPPIRSSVTTANLERSAPSPGARTSPNVQQRFFELHQDDIPTAKVRSAQYARQFEREHALKQNQTNYEGRQQIADVAAQDSRNIAGAKFNETVQIADRVQTMREGAANQQYGYSMQGAAISREGSHQASGVRQQGSYKAAEITQGGQYKSADINMKAQMESARLAYEGRKMATDIQFEAAAKSSHMRALSSMWSSIGSNAGHHIAEASEKFSRL